MTDESSELEIDRAALNVARECTCMNLRQATRVVTQFYDNRLAPSGLKITQLPILAGLAAGPMPVGRLAEKLVMDRTTLTRNLQPLERRGFVSDGRGEARRARLIALSPRGREALERAIPLWQSAQEALTDSLGHMHSRVLLDNLRAATRAVKRLDEDERQ